MHNTKIRTTSRQKLRRNRAMLGAGLGVTVLGMVALAGNGVLNRHRHAAPMLAVIDEMPVRTQPAVNVPASERITDYVGGLGMFSSFSREPVAGVLRNDAHPDEASPAHLVAAPVEPVEQVNHSTHISELEAPEIRWFNGRPIRPAGTMTMVVTAYSPDERSCGDSADGITASGYSVWTNGMKLVAADTSVLPFGAMISVPGYDRGEVVPVLDRGGAIKGNRLDVLYPTHEQAMRWGVQELQITVWEYADGEPDGFKTAHQPARVASR